MSDAPDSGEQQAAQEAFDTAAAGGSPGALPDIDFSTFILSLAHSARVHLGDAPNPGDNQTQVELPMARQTIDLLALLQDKTRGNLTGDEERLLAQALYDLRLRYVEVKKGSGAG